MFDMVLCRVTYSVHVSRMPQAVPHNWLTSAEMQLHNKPLHLKPPFICSVIIPAFLYCFNGKWFCYVSVNNATLSCFECMQL